MADEFVQLETKPPNLSDRVGREIQEDPKLVISRARVASTLSSPGSVPKTPAALSTVSAILGARNVCEPCPMHTYSRRMTSGTQSTGVSDASEYHCLYR